VQGASVETKCLEPKKLYKSRLTIPGQDHSSVLVQQQESSHPDDHHTNQQSSADYAKSPSTNKFNTVFIRHFSGSIRGFGLLIPQGNLQDKRKSGHPLQTWRWSCLAGLLWVKGALWVTTANYVNSAKQETMD